MSRVVECADGSLDIVPDDVPVTPKLKAYEVRMTGDKRVVCLVEAGSGEDAAKIRRESARTLAKMYLDDLEVLEVRRLHDWSPNIAATSIRLTT